MPHHETIALSGTIQHVFAHRFTLDAEGRTHLADLGPKGAEAFPLAAGLAVTLEGERRPSEIKVTRITAGGGEPVMITHKKPQHAPGHVHPDLPADPVRALAAVKDAGWTAEGEPVRKPKHFEVVARRDGGDRTELHVDFAGEIYKQRPAR
jgi:hypothetical protein